MGSIIGAALFLRSVPENIFNQNISRLLNGSTKDESPPVTKY